MRTGQTLAQPSLTWERSEEREKPDPPTRCPQEPPLSVETREGTQRDPGSTTEQTRSQAESLCEFLTQPTLQPEHRSGIQRGVT